ncbi:MAG: hypothetical protein PHT58_02950 [Eubacteriales bacterium]|nr:hypothetical protein [Eubacteriales bacterium]
MKATLAFLLVLLLLVFVGCDMFNESAPSVYCSYPDCYEYCVDGTNYCARHTPVSYEQVQYCLVEGCFNTAFVGGLCNQHVCLQEGCTARRVSQMYCAAHGG